MNEPNPAAEYFAMRARQDKLEARKHRRARFTPRPSAVRTESIVSPYLGWRAIADREARIASAELMARANGRAYDARRLEAQARAFVDARSLSPAWATRIASDWVTRQSLKATLYKIVVRMHLGGISAARAIRELWDASLGAPPSERELEAMAADFARSL